MQLPQDATEAVTIHDFGTLPRRAAFLALRSTQRVFLFAAARTAIPAPRKSVFSIFMRRGNAT